MSRSNYDPTRGSALTSKGSTRAWSKMRENWKLRLINAATAGRPLTCPRCSKPILPSDAWDLGHVVDRASGGTDADGVRPEHAACNRRAGQALSGIKPCRW